MECALMIFKFLRVKLIRAEKDVKLMKVRVQDKSLRVAQDLEELTVEMVETEDLKLIMLRQIKSVQKLSLNLITTVKKQDMRDLEEQVAMLIKLLVVPVVVSFGL